jgi:acetoin:2,6-dichlorophenolindophenol oxidoreductase subunit beta
VKTVLDSLNSALHRSMKADPCVYLIGEDILDPYGGAFKVTRGLSTEYPDRVWTTPISEAGMVGVAAGMALRGLRPVVEIMFGDFLTLAADQLINHAAKFRWMYNDQVRAPMVIRTPMGGRRGYGPTHSQSLEKFFLGAPGLRVLAPGPFAASGVEPGSFLESAILESEDPVLFIENKLLYLLPVRSPGEMPEFQLIYSPGEDKGSENSRIRTGFFKLRIEGAPQPVLTVAAYGYMAELVCQAVLRLAYEHEVFAEVISPIQLSPFQIDPVIESVRETGRLLIVEEGSLSMGWGAEVTARTTEKISSSRFSARRLAAPDAPVPASVPLEERALPGVEDILNTALDFVNSRR